MKKIYIFLLPVMAIYMLSSCMSTYNIRGTSNISTLDGRMLYLKVLKDNEFKNIDSCDVVHGEFHFHGSIDSARMANIFMENEQLMPIVIESGDIDVKVDDTQMEVSGTPLNEKLFAFLKQFNQVTGEQADLVHRHDQAIMDGVDMNNVVRELQMEDVRLSVLADSLVTTFVTENFDNVLGPGVFFLTTIGYDYPLLTPWVEDIMSKATDKFKNDPYVKDYYTKAQENQQIMNGLRDVPETSPAIGGQMPHGLGTVPTPNELAKPTK
jgi:hypothetical protein